MKFKDIPIQRKLMSAIMLTCTVVLVFICTAYILLEYTSSKNILTNKVSTLGNVVASNSSAALAFDSEADAIEILHALKGDKSIVAAALYDKEGNLFARYPQNISPQALPERPGAVGYEFQGDHLQGFEPVLQANDHLGTLFIRSNMNSVYAQMKRFILIALLLIAGSLGVAYLLSIFLQKSISQPILALENTAKVISGTRDYTIRAVKSGDDEIGSLTDNFNNMLVQIEYQNSMLSEREEHLRLAVQAAELGTFDMNINTGAITWDQRCKELLGLYKDASDAANQHQFDGATENDQGRISKILHNVLETQEADGNYDAVYRVTGFNNKVRWVRVKGKMFFNEANKPVRFLGAVLDFTNQKQEELRKNDFIAIISHELKTPLTTIKSYIQILLAKARKEEDAFELNALGRADAQTVKIASMINDFLNLARIEEGKLRINKEVFCLNTFLEDTIAEAAFLTSNHDLKVINCQGLNVYADKDKIAQVLINLISNATKYSPPGSTILIGCEKVNGSVRIYVSDNGIGINREHQKKLFNRFYRVENEKSKTVSGFGIGLYLVSEILRYHDSNILVESEEGNGSTFSFNLESVEGQPA
ncbi:MAG TPA: ATP-binding protein [Sphingobacteriaceae bacterium]